MGRHLRGHPHRGRRGGPDPVQVAGHERQPGHQQDRHHCQGRRCAGKGPAVRFRRTQCRGGAEGHVQKRRSTRSAPSPTGSGSTGAGTWPRPAAAPSRSAHERRPHAARRHGARGEGAVPAGTAPCRRMVVIGFALLFVAVVAAAAFQLRRAARDPGFAARRARKPESVTRSNPAARNGLVSEDFHKLLYS